MSCKSPPTEVATMRKNITLGLILTSAMAFGTLVVAAPAAPDAGPHRGGHGHMHRHGHDMALRKLDLTDAQRASIKQIVHTSFAQNKPQWQRSETRRVGKECVSKFRTRWLMNNKKK